MPAAATPRGWPLPAHLDKSRHTLLSPISPQIYNGCYPVAVRYLQTRIAHPLSSLQLTFAINAVACLALLLCTTLPVLVRRWLRGRRDGAEEMAEDLGWEAAGGTAGSLTQPLVGQAESHGSIGSTGDNLKLLGQWQRDEPAAPAGAAAHHRALRREIDGRRFRLSRRAVLLLLGTTAALTSVMLAQVYSLLFTQVRHWSICTGEAYWCCTSSQA